MEKKTPKTSFAAKLLMCFLIIGIIPSIFMGALAYSYLDNQSAKRVEKESSKIVDLATSELITTLDEYKRLLSCFCADEEVERALQMNQISTDTRANLYHKMYLMLAGRPVSTKMYLLKKDASFMLSSSTEIPDIYRVKNHANWGIFRAMNSSSQPILYPNKRISSNGRIYCVAIGCKIYSGGKTIGYGILEIPEEVFCTIFSSAKTFMPCSYAVLDSHYYYLYDYIFKGGLNTESFHWPKDLNQKQKCFFYLNQPKRLIVCKKVSGANPLIVVACVPVEFIEKNSKYIRDFAIAVAITATIISIILLPILVKNLTKPLDKITETMQKVQNGDTDARIMVKEKDEFGFIECNLNKMLDNLETLYQTNLEKTHCLQIAELKNLQAQINPHFLYNTLDSIKWMAKLNGIDEISTMVSQLGKLLKNSIHNQKDIISVKEEISLVQSYLAIQQIRYEEKFKAEIKIDPNILNGMIPKFIIQPLVENAIGHGIENKVDSAVLKIVGEKSGGNMLFKIIDDGVGMPKEKLNELKNGEYRQRVGLANVEKRIQLYYGTEYGVTIVSELNKGTTVTITMPYKL